VATISTCPDCRQVIKQRVTPNRIIVNMASQVVVECEACKWIGTREESTRHLCPNAAPAPQPASKKKAGFFQRLFFGGGGESAPPPPQPQQTGSQQAEQSQPQLRPEAQPRVEPQRPPPVAVEPVHVPSIVIPSPPATAVNNHGGSATVVQRNQHGARPGEEWMYELFPAFPNLDPDLILDICRTAGYRDAALDMLSVIHADAPPRHYDNTFASSPVIQQPVATPTPVASAQPQPPAPPATQQKYASKGAPAFTFVAPPTLIPTPATPAPSATQPVQSSPQVSASHAPPPTGSPAAAQLPASVPKASGPAVSGVQPTALPPKPQPSKYATLPVAQQQAPPEWDPFDPAVAATSLAAYEAQQKLRGITPPPSVPSPAGPSAAVVDPHEAHLNQLLGKFATPALDDDFDAPLFDRPPPPPVAVPDPEVLAWRPTLDDPPQNKPTVAAPITASLRADSWDRPLDIAVPTSRSATNEPQHQDPQIACIPPPPSAAMFSSWDEPVVVSPPVASNVAGPTPTVATQPEGTFDDIFARFAATS
jgi:hypothetical protein